MDNPRLSEPRIVCAANRDASGHIVCGARHFDGIMHMQIQKMTSYTEPWEQGFIDQHGRFYTRQEAWTVAHNNNQIIRQEAHTIGTLYSENLY